MAIQKTIINGHTITYDNSTVEQGIYFLGRIISMEEAKVFFDEAYNKGSALFEDRMGYKFKLVHHDDGYELVKPVI